MSIEDVEDFCEVCDGVVHSNRKGYNAHKSDCSCKLIKVKLVREVMHAQGPSQFFARWLKLRARPVVNELVNVDGDIYAVDSIEHVSHSVCTLIAWVKADTRTYNVNLGRHNIKTPPKALVDGAFDELCAEYEAAKWFRTVVWWRKS